MHKWNPASISVILCHFVFLREWKLLPFWLEYHLAQIILSTLTDRCRKMLKLLQLSSHQNTLPSQLTMHHKTGGNATCGFNAKQLLHSSTPSGLLLTPRTALLQGLSHVRGLRRPAMNMSPHTPGRPNPNTLSLQPPCPDKWDQALPGEHLGWWNTRPLSPAISKPVPFPPFQAAAPQSWGRTSLSRRRVPPQPARSPPWAPPFPGASAAPRGRGARRGPLSAPLTDTRNSSVPT